MLRNLRSGFDGCVDLGSQLSFLSGWFHGQPGGGDEIGRLAKWKCSKEIWLGDTEETLIDGE